LIFKDIPRANLEIYVSEQDGTGGNAFYNAFLVDVIEEPSGRSTTRRIVLHTRDDSTQLQTPAQALYRLFLLTAIHAETSLRAEFL
jgi:hypothetical protein